MLDRLASLAMSTSVPKALPGKLDIKRHSPSILYIFYNSGRHNKTTKGCNAGCEQPEYEVVGFTLNRYSLTFRLL